MVRHIGSYRPVLLAILLVLVTMLVGACNLSSAPEEQLELTSVPTTTLLPTRTQVGDSTFPTPRTVTALPQVPTNSPGQLPSTSVSFPPTVSAFPSSTPLPVTILILSPVPGNVVAGNVQVIGAASHPQFLQFFLEYGPDPNPGNLWYATSGVSQQPVINGLLGFWNTTVIPDGNYQLRLRVILRDGTSLGTVVNQIRVQNRVATPVPTNTTVPRPIAAFTQDRVSGQAPLVVRFINRSSGQISSFSWDFGDGGTSPEANPIYTFRSPGIYNVRLTVRGPGGRANVSRDITVQSGTPPVAAFTQDKTSGVSPLAIQFTDRSSGNITSRLWDFGDGTTSRDQNPSHTFNTVGTYNIILTVVGTGGSSSVRRQITVQNPTVPEPIAALVAQPIEGDAPLTVQFDATDSSGQIENYNWDFGDGEVGNGVVVTHIYQEPGDYEAELIVVGPGGQSRRTVMVNVSRKPDSPVAAFTVNPESGETPLTVQFDASGSTGQINSYNWDFGDGETGTGATTSHVFNDPGTYTVNLSVQGPGGENSATLDVSAVEPVQPPEAAFEPLPASGTAPLEVQFTNQSLGEELVFTWDFGDGSPTSNENDPIHIYEEPGDYTAILTATGPGGTDTAELPISVSQEVVIAPPTASFTSNPTNGTAPLSVEFAATQSDDITRYLWNFDDGSAEVEGPTTTHIFNTVGNYAVTLTVFGAGGQNSVQTNIVVEAPAPSAPDAIFNANPTSGQAPLTVNVDATGSTGAIDTYNWDFGDGIGTAQGPTASYAYPNAGDFNITLRVVGPGGEDTAQTPISVTAPAPSAPDAIINANPTSGEAPLTVNVDATGSTGQIDSYNWDFGDGIGTAQGPTASYAYPNAGDFTITLRVVGPGGEDTAQTPISVTAPAPSAPDAIFNANPISGEAPLTVNVDATGSTGAIDTYNWDFGDGIGTAQGPTASYAYPNAGDFTIILRVVGPGGEDTAQTPISVTAPAPSAPDAIINANPISGEAPLTVNVDATGSTGPIDSYNWDFGDSLGTAQGPTASYAYPNAGDFTITLRVVGPGGEDTAQTPISVTASAPEAPVAIINANPATGQAPLTVSFDGSGSTGQIDSYTWDFGDGLGTAQGPTATYEYPTAGDFTATLRVAGPGGENIAEVAISVTAPAPSAPVAIINANPATGQAPLEVSFDGSGSTGQIDGYEWNFGDGGTAQGATTIYTYPNAGEFRATLRVFGAGGENTTEVLINVGEAAFVPGIVQQVPVLPDLGSQQVRNNLSAIYNNGLNSGKRPNVFAIIGDSLARQSGYLAPLTDPANENSNSGLQEIIDWYNGVDLGNGRTSFDRRSQATDNGWLAQDLLDPSRSDGSNCNGGETPLDCEIRLIQPAVALVSVGVNDVAQGTDPAAFRATMEQILQRLLSQGVIPVVSTLQPNPNNPRPTDAINTAIIEAVRNVEAANNTSVPIYNLWLNFTNLPDNGLQGDNVTPTVANSGAGNVNDNPASQFGLNARNRSTLSVLNDLRNQIYPDATP